MKDIDLAYIAGIIDGEGCISANGSKYLKPTIEVLMTTEQPLKWIYETVGLDNLYLGSEARLNRKQPLRWVVSAAEDILIILSNIKPYLKLKLPQAQALLVLCYLRRTKVNKFSPRKHIFAEDKISRILWMLKQDEINYAYQEALDLVVYLRQVIEERDNSQIPRI